MLTCETCGTPGHTVLCVVLSKEHDTEPPREGFMCKPCIAQRKPEGTGVSSRGFVVPLVGGVARRTA